jgi:hypothetical protein
MTRRSLLAAALVALVAVAGCRQPDGPLPIETADDPNRLSDVGRDLLNAAAGDANAPQELADDIRVWVGAAEAAQQQSDELARRVAAAVKGKNLTPGSAGQFARHLWIAAAGRELSSRQVEGLKDDVATLLVAAGAAEADAAPVAEQIDALQETVTTKRRWWFQLF